MTADVGEGSPPGAPQSGKKRRSYNDIRDAFLAELPQTAEEELQYFTRIGMFVFYRWQAIADDHEDGEPIDETAHDGRWDECTLRDLEQIRSDACGLITKEAARTRLWALRNYIWENTKPLYVAARAVAWTGKRMGEHIVGAIGIILFAILIAKLFPEVVKSARVEFDELTAAHSSIENHAPLTHQGSQAGQQRESPLLITTDHNRQAP